MSTFKFDLAVDFNVSYQVPYQIHLHLGRKLWTANMNFGGLNDWPAWRDPSSRRQANAAPVPLDPILVDVL